MILEFEWKGNAWEEPLEVWKWRPVKENLSYGLP